jgi:glycosyltransferase involved in cell wall biosynthesis
LLIRAFQVVAAADPDVRLTIYGEGELRAFLESLISKLGLDDRVSLPGNVADVHARICNAKCFVHCSSYEGLPNALMEALTLGLACVSTDWNGSGDLIQNEVDGLIVPLNDADALAAAILRILKERALAERLQSGARNEAATFQPVSTY